MKQKNFTFITAALLIVLFYGGSIYYKKMEAQKTTQAAQKNKANLVRNHSPAIGSFMAKVSVVEFLDPECESCRMFHPIMKGLLKKYEGSIHYVVRYAPFHPNSILAIKVLEGARKQNKYWETLDLLFEKLPEWGDHHNPQPELIWTYLPTLGLDVEAIKADLENKEVLANIEIDKKDVEAFNVRGTPTFFINGKPLPSFGVEQLKNAIAAAAQ